ncbi:MAG: GNAT family N-acetyltransferase, partial [Oscillospiraceae bacterium]
TVPDVEEFAARMRATLRRYPYLVAERGGELVGYAYAGPFGERAAYDWAVEMSIYLREDQRHQGTGKRLYAALEAVLRAQNVQNLYACIGYPDGADDAHLTKNSAQFHAHLGYRLVGEFSRCGYKFGTWYSMVWMEKCIGAHEESPAPVCPFPELSPAELESILDHA